MRGTESKCNHIRSYRVKMTPLRSACRLRGMPTIRPRASICPRDRYITIAYPLDVIPSRAPLPCIRRPRGARPLRRRMVRVRRRAPVAGSETMDRSA